MTLLKLHKNKHNTKGGVNNGDTFFRKNVGPPLQISFNPLQIFENIVTLSTVILPTKNIETVAIFLEILIL